MITEEVTEDINDYINSLFNNLLYNVQPKMISNKSISYEVDNIEIELIWFTKREKDNEHGIPIIDSNPFKDKSSRFQYTVFDWEIDNSKELEGYSFYINTPAGQYKVPELSRKELVDVQERIEELYQIFGYNYIKNLVQKSNKQ